MPKETGFFASSIGKKVVMAITGLMLVGFVVGHMAGNLQLYLHPHAGAEHPLDLYGKFLKESLHGAGIWLARGGLLAAAALHVWAAVGLTRMNTEARPVGYAVQVPQASTLASRWMRISGFLVLAFVVFHLAHFTFGKFVPNFEEGKVYANVVAGFQVPWVSAFYILAMLGLASHLSHGIWSLMQTLGWSHPRFNDLRLKIARGLTALVILANISFPLAVLFGFVK